MLERIIIIILAGLGRCWIGRFRRSKLFTAKDVTEASCLLVAYQSNILENFSASFGGMEDWMCVMYNLGYVGKHWVVCDDERDSLEQF